MISPPVLTVPWYEESAIRPARISGQPFDGRWDARQSRQKHLPRKLFALTVTAILAVLVPVAHASPPDPTGIPGLYDNADYDDVVGFVTDGTGVSNRQALARGELGPMACVLLPETGPGPTPMTRAQMTRGPPVEAPDASVRLLPKRAPPVEPQDASAQSPCRTRYLDDSFMRNTPPV
jgi:hypothetical protein